MAVIEIATAADLAKIGVEETHPLSGDYIQTADITGVTAGISLTFSGSYDGRGWANHLPLHSFNPATCRRDSTPKYGTQKKNNIQF